MASSVSRIFSIAGFASLVILGANPVSANGCFGGGEAYTSVGSTAEISTAITDACNALAASYTVGEKKTFCSDFPSGNRVNWAVTSQAFDTETLTETDCFNAMLTEFVGCSTGSKQVHGDFLFEDDPNAGSC